VKVPDGLAAELERERQRLVLVDEQIAGLEQQQEQLLANPQKATQEVAAKLVKLRGIGPVSAWMLAHEFFGWRKLKTRRQVDWKGDLQNRTKDQIKNSACNRGPHRRPGMPHPRPDRDGVCRQITTSGVSLCFGSQSPVAVA
jgi:transposase